ncbi:MAG TPA: hypothetical protein EYN89_12815 [Flavobacteriales bacterium]|nr:hypothetical protein [Flavobacteriales bacterium]
MGKPGNNILIGILAAVIFGGLIIFAIEDKRSFLQILAGFAFCIIPFTFLSSFSSKIASFLLAVTVIVLAYVAYKLEYQDFWIGIVMAAVTGGAAFYFRVNKYKPFSPSDYKEEAENQHNNKNTEEE